MKLIEVNTTKTIKQFHGTQRILYKNDPNFICPLEIQVENVFNPKKNEKFAHGEAIRWILQDDQGQLIGRIGSFVDKEYSESFDKPVGGIGFFECINNQEAANLLFDTAKQWLEQRGMEAMDGPINFGPNYSFWGLLVDGFVPQGFGMNYNFPYYQQLFENYGFKTYYNQYTYHIDMANGFPERFWKIAERFAQRPGYKVETLDVKNFERFAEGFTEIYNKTWPTFKKDFSPVSKEQIRKAFEQVKFFLDPDFLLIGYHNDKPVAFYINIPDLNQVLQHLNGKMTLLNKLKLIYYIKFTHTITRLRGFVFGIIPEYQRSGIDAIIYWKANQAWQSKPHMKEVELSWVGDFNPKMRNMWYKYGAKIKKQYKTYRILFDPDAKFERYPIPDIPLNH